MSQQQVQPSPWATHADLSALRREIQLDVRHELSLIREALVDMESKTATNKQWAWNIALSLGNVAVAAWYVLWSVTS